AASGFLCHCPDPYSFPVARVSRDVGPTGPTAKRGSRRKRPAPKLFLEGQTALTRGLSQRLDTAMINIRAAVEHDFLDAGLDGAFGKQLADLRCRGLIGAGLERTLQVLLKRRSRCKRSAVHIVDD